MMKHFQQWNSGGGNFGESPANEKNKRATIFINEGSSYVHKGTNTGSRAPRPSIVLVHSGNVLWSCVI